MTYSLDSFGSEFWGNPGGEFVSKWVNAKTVAQALWNMRHEDWIKMVEVLFPDDSSGAIYPDVNNVDIINLIRRTNTCTNLDSPVEVWIDEEGDYKIKVYA